MNNGRRHSAQTKERARQLRKNGKTHREIKKELGVSLASAHLWTKGIKLTVSQQKAIRERQNKVTFTVEYRKNHRESAKVHLAPYWKEKYTREDLLNKIRDFYSNYGRIPLKREFNMYQEYKRRFGSWNNAIELAGFEPHQVIFSKKFIAKDGHTCDSFAEKIIDDWLFQNGVPHERHVQYSKTKMTADFAIGKIRIEYFGLAGEVRGYDDIIRRKRNICLQASMRLVEIYPPNLFSKDFKQCLGRILREIREYS